MMRLKRVFSFEVGVFQVSRRALFPQGRAAVFEIVYRAHHVSTETDARPLVSDFKNKALADRHAASEVIQGGLGRISRQLFRRQRPGSFHHRMVREAIANFDEWAGAVFLPAFFWGDSFLPESRRTKIGSPVEQYK